ncbi:hypothetical protein [Actinoplanes flavus]|uniref:Protein kinase domain-containing protein n=1 Tax=Actinoplanes flavus TaxID=2820290 RepID=A0ABS3UEI1_9ACTN|nr:hypothetical protein [Actinoplanes flavus]MBO3736636.1 hypothetical protein [Actinoplanes flavus]
MISVVAPAGYRWDPTGRVAAGIRDLIGERLAARPPHAAVVVDRLLHLTGDYRLAALFLRPDTPDSIVRLCERLAATADPHDRARLQHELGRQRFARPGTATVVLAGDLEQVLTAPDGTTCAYVPDPTQQDTVRALLHDFGTGLSEFVESQHEVPGPNARIRQGIVKSWYLPDGTRVVSKRANPAKPGRFAREQRAYHDLATRLAGSVTFGRSRQLQLAPLLATIRDGTTGRVYAIWRWVPGNTVEAMLTAPGDHRPLLHDYRDLMDALLDRGVLWGDLSPRNILVHGGTYHLVDFEKTHVIDDIPVPHPQRVAYCRGQVGIEELGVLCPPEELRACLYGYFDPDSWHLNDSGPVPFPPRPEVTAVLAGRGITTPGLGEYNRVDRQIWQVRAPDRDPLSGKIRYPGLVNFRVEHYLSCAGHDDPGDYDRKATEILIAAREHGCFDATVHALTVFVDEVERQFVTAEVADLLAGNDTEPVTPPYAAIRAFTDCIDVLDAARPDPGRFQAACATLLKELP